MKFQIYPISVDVAPRKWRIRAVNLEGHELLYFDVTLEELRDLAETAAGPTNKIVPKESPVREVMSRRDEFAKAAMQSIIAKHPPAKHPSDDHSLSISIAKGAADYADTLIAELDK